MIPSAAATRRSMPGRLAVIGFMLAGLLACTAASGEPQEPSYIVFFTPFSAQLDEPAGGVVAAAAQAAQGAPGHRVVVAGYASSVGSAAANVTLSKLRAQVVADRLAAQGVDRGRITIRARGAVGGDPDVESRRVEIDLY